ncbi:ATP-binding cassette domain-containing protein, partial [Variovorax sp. CAN2819]|uniref:ATP-binding cassette domain-containing protein n=1 Tax=Variovorax sp. CAN15 TaxID=3046727 RepID=UPI0026490131
MTPAAPLIEVRGLKKYFGSSDRPVRAVDDVSFAIQPGETLGLVGESGSGKSTIGRTVLRLVERTSGQVFYRGDDIGELSAERMRRLRSKLQIIFQDPYASLNPKMRISAILGEALSTHGLHKGAAALGVVIGLVAPWEDPGLQWHPPRPRAAC